MMKEKLGQNNLIQVVFAENKRKIESLAIVKERVCWD